MSIRLDLLFHRLVNINKRCTYSYKLAPKSTHIFQNALTCHPTRVLAHVSVCLCYYRIDVQVHTQHRRPRNPTLRPAIANEFTLTHRLARELTREHIFSTPCRLIYHTHASLHENHRIRNEDERMRMRMRRRMRAHGQ